LAFCDEASHNEQRYFVLGAVYFVLKEDADSAVVDRERRSPANRPQDQGRSPVQIEMGQSADGNWTLF
jgi:hypothetical protein